MCSNRLQCKSTETLIIPRLAYSFSDRWLVTVGALINGSISLNGVSTGQIYDTCLISSSARDSERLIRAAALAPCISVDVKANGCERVGSRCCRRRLFSFLTLIYHPIFSLSPSLRNDSLLTLGIQLSFL
jgi:hypothetical protein